MERTLRPRHRLGDVMDLTSIQPGLVFHNRYRVVRLLQHSSMGSVYAAVDEQKNRQVVLKVVGTAIAADLQARQRFVREAKNAARIEHLNIVRTYDVGDGPYGPFLVQELIDGYSLHKDVPLSPQRTLEVALAIAQALEYLHARGYVHCDIKPSNIMVTSQNGRERIVLLHFGIAHVTTAAETTLHPTPQYTAPERIRDEVATGWSDLYALGITLFYLLNGRVPFDGPTMGSVVKAQLYNPLPPFGTADPHAALLRPIVERFCERTPSPLCVGCRVAYRAASSVQPNARHTTVNTNSAGPACSAIHAISPPLVVGAAAARARRMLGVRAVKCT